jgi:hypothetical protein
VLLAAGGSACECCKVYCPQMLTAVFVDPAGNPLTPESVSMRFQTRLDGGFDDLRSCGDLATCDGNKLTFDVHTSEPTTIHAKAVTGEVFEGEIAPAWRNASSSVGLCGCTGSVATLEITLSPP